MTGPTGSSSSLGDLVVVTDDRRLDDLGNGDGVILAAACPPPSTLVSGGYFTDSTKPGALVVIQNLPLDQTWQVVVFATAHVESVTLTAFALCTPTPP